MGYIDSNGNIHEGEDFEGLLNKVKEQLRFYYAPVQDPKDADFHMSTTEMWQQLLTLFPNEMFLTKDLVAIWMHSLGFTFYDFGEFKFEWLVKKV